MAETDAYKAGVFYTGSFITTEVVQTFSELGIDRRVSLLVDIEARPQVSQIIINHTPTITPQPTNLASIYHHFHVTAGGALQRSIAAVQFADKTDHYITRWPPPSYLVFTDEGGFFRYVTSPTGQPSWVASGTQPANFTVAQAQFVGEYIEMIAADGVSIYRISVNSSNVISTTLNRTEPERAATIRVQEGRRFAFDGTNVWVPGLTKLGDLNSALDHHDYGYGGVSIARVADIDLQLADDEFEYLVNQSFDTRDVTVRVGLSDQDISEYRVVLRGKTERVEADLNNLRIVLRDQNVLLERSMQTRTYPGTTGGYNGTSDLTGVYKPLLYGICRHISPLLLDSVRLTYQIHDGPIHQIFSIHEGGALHTSIGDIADHGLANLNFWVPTLAQVNSAVYMTDLSRGCFKFAAPPVKPLTVVAQGHTSVPFGNPQVGRIIETILETRVPEAMIDRNSLDEFLVDQQGGAGIYIMEETSVKEAFRELLAPIAANLHMDNLNRVTVRQLKCGIPVAFLRANGMMESGIGVQPLPHVPGAQYKVGYNRAWTVFNESDYLDNASSVVVNTFLKNEYRYQLMPLTGPGITRLPHWSSAKTVEINTLMDNAVQAGAIAVRIAHLNYTMQRLYRLTVTGFPYQIQIGDTVMLQLDQIGVNGNVRTGIVVEVTDRAPSDSNEDQTELVIAA